MDRLNCNMATCNYCGRSEPHKNGDVYCSRSGDNMESLNNGMFVLNPDKEFSDEHITRLTLRISLQGEQEYIYNKKTYSVKGPQGLIMSSGATYRVRSSEQNTKMFGLAFNPHFIHQQILKHSRQLLEFGQGPTDPIHFSNHGMLMLSSEDLLILNNARIALMNNKDPLYLYQVYQYIFDLLFKKEMEYKKSISSLEYVFDKSRAEVEKRLKMGHDYMLSNYATIKNIAEIANASMLSEPHFVRLFKKVYGCTVYQFLQKVRMEAASYWLSKGSLSVQEIATKVGYPNHSSFSRAFKVQTGTSPKNKKG